MNYTYGGSPLRIASHRSLNMHSTLSIAISLLGISVRANPQAASKGCPKGVLSIPLTCVQNISGYGTECEWSGKNPACPSLIYSVADIWTVQVGTPPQPNILKADTGSWTIGLETPNNTDCASPDKPCELYGTFDNLTSSTSVYISDYYNDLVGDHGQGDILNDTITMGGLTVPNFEFGVIDINYLNGEILPSPQLGIIGEHT
jgi:hypothetical protein